MMINKSIKYCLENQIFDALNQIYDSVPSGTCQECTKCCNESVNISMVEGLNIIHQYFEHENGTHELTENISVNLLKFYFSEWVKPKKCPFLNEHNLCSIYLARPLPCRIFGNRSKEAYDHNLRKVRMQNLRAAQVILSDFNLKVPRSVINRTIEYCEDYQRGRILEEDNVNELYDALINLDGKLFFGGVISEMQVNQHLVGFFMEHLLLDDIYEIVTPKLLEEIRLEILRGININNV